MWAIRQVVSGARCVSRSVIFHGVISKGRRSMRARQNSSSFNEGGVVMIVFKFNPATKSWDDRDEMCEAKAVGLGRAWGLSK